VLRSSGHRPSRQHRPEHVGGRDAGGEPAGDQGRGMPDAGPLRHPVELLDLDRTGRGDPSEVVALEVHDHDVLGLVLGAAEQDLGAGAGAFDRHGGDPVARDPDQLLGRGGGHSPPVPAHGAPVGGTWKGQDCFGQRQRVARERSLPVPDDIGLVDLASPDRLPDRFHRFGVSSIRPAGRPRTDLSRPGLRSPPGTLAVGNRHALGHAGRTRPPCGHLPQHSAPDSPQQYLDHDVSVLRGGLARQAVGGEQVQHVPRIRGLHPLDLDERHLPLRGATDRSSSPRTSERVILDGVQ
jgi:hypothetical protein